jgi:hypothetical protein
MDRARDIGWDSVRNKEVILKAMLALLRLRRIRVETIGLALDLLIRSGHVKRLTKGWRETVNIACRCLLVVGFRSAGVP